MELSFEEYVKKEARDLFKSDVVSEEVMQILRCFENKYYEENNYKVKRMITIAIANNVDNELRHAIYLSCIEDEIKKNNYNLVPFMVFDKLISLFVFIDTDEVALRSIKDFVREENDLVKKQFDFI